jgi:hypothetical protein
MIIHISPKIIKSLHLFLLNNQNYRIFKTRYTISPPPPQNDVFHNVIFLVHKMFTFHIKNVLKFRCSARGPNGTRHFHRIAGITWSSWMTVITIWKGMLMPVVMNCLMIIFLWLPWRNETDRKTLSKILTWAMNNKTTRHSNLPATWI